MTAMGVAACAPAMTDYALAAHQQGLLPHRCRRVDLHPLISVRANTCIATLDVKLKTPNGANVNVKGKQAFDSTTTASVC